MCTCSLLHCVALFPFRFTPSNSAPIGLIVVLQALHDRYNKKVFFYSRDQIAHYLRDYWAHLTSDARELLITLTKDESLLPESSWQHMHITENHELEVMRVLSLSLGLASQVGPPDIPIEYLEPLDEAA